MLKYHALRQKFDCNVPSFINERSSSFDLALEVAFLLWNENRGKSDQAIRERMPFLFWRRNVDVEKIVYDPNAIEAWLKTADQQPFSQVPFMKVRVLVPLTLSQAIRREIPSVHDAAELLIQEGIFDYQDLKEHIARKHSCVGHG